MGSSNAREVAVQIAEGGVALVRTGDDEASRRRGAPRRRRRPDDHDDASSAYGDYERHATRTLDTWQDAADERLDAEIDATSGKGADVFDVGRAIRGAVPKRCSQVEAEIIKALAVMIWSSGKHHFNQPCPRECPACLGQGGKHLGAKAISKVLRLEEPKEPLETSSLDTVRPRAPAEIVEVRLESVRGVVVGARVDVDRGRWAETSRVHAVDFEASSIQLRLERPHGPGRFSVVVHPHRTPFQSVDDALRFLGGDYELGRGAGGDWKRDERGELAMLIADDRDEDRIARAVLERRGRLPVVSREREKTGTVTRYASAGGFLPIEFVRAKQSANGKLGGARNETRIELAEDVARAVGAAALGALDKEILFALADGAAAKEIAESVAAQQSSARAMAKSDPFVLGRFTEAARRLAIAGDVTEEDVRARVRRARRAIAEQLAARGLIPPREPRKAKRWRLLREPACVERIVAARAPKLGGEQ